MPYQNDQKYVWFWCSGTETLFKRNDFGEKLFKRIHLRICLALKVINEQLKITHRQDYCTQTEKQTKKLERSSEEKYLLRAH